MECEGRRDGAFFFAGGRILVSTDNEFCVLIDGGTSDVDRHVESIPIFFTL